MDDRQGWTGKTMKTAVGFGSRNPLKSLKPLNPTLIDFYQLVKFIVGLVSGLPRSMISMGYKAESDKSDSSRRSNPTAARPSGMSGFPLGNPTSDALGFSDDLNGKISYLND